jgi:diguanylate cyclase
MSKQVANGAARPALTLHSSALIEHGRVQNGVSNFAPARLQRAPSGLAALRQALALSRGQTKAGLLQIKTLAETNLLLEQELLRLAQEVARARHFAYYDQLTGLPNRSLLMDRLDQAIDQAARQQKQVVLLLLDLDGFKRVNDRLGHAAGDKLLQQVAQRLIACTRGADTACRYGGDEFVIMLPEFDGGESAAAVAEKIRVQLTAPYAIDGGAFVVTASIGTAIYPHDGDNYNDLIAHADIAMYCAKAQASAPTYSSLHVHAQSDFSAGSASSNRNHAAT